MFTGMVDHSGCIRSIEKSGTGLSFAIQTQFKSIELGESVAVDGVCLTVTKIDGSLFYCDVSPETLSLTTLAYYQVGQFVNLERALRVGDRFGGHYVTGHVDRTAVVKSVEIHEVYAQINFHEFPEHEKKQLIHKGSIALNGVSLTINAIEPALSVLLIPHTLQVTSLKNLKPGDRVNVEFDYYVKIILAQGVQ